MPEIGDVVRLDGRAGVVVAKANGKRAVRWEPLVSAEVSAHRPGELEVVRRLTTNGRKPEPDGFVEWLEDHAEATEGRVMAAGTKARAHVAGMFGARREEGYSLEDLKLATRGAFGDEYRREHGYYDPESVLRPTKVAKLIEGGRLVAERGTTITDPWGMTVDPEKYARFG